MAFLNPLLLFGAAGIAVPIVIHLLNNRKVKRVVWAAMRFLETSVQKNKGKLKIEDLVLLALRCLLLLLLACALARPALKSAGLALPGGGGGPVVVLLDNSYSMSETDGASSRFDQARKAGEKIVETLPLGAPVGVFLFSDIVQPLIPEPSMDRNLARKVIREAALSDRGTQIEPALRQAVEVLGRKPGGAKQIFLITDGQAIGWARLKEIREQIEAAKTDVRVTVVLVGEAGESNVGVTDLRMGSPLAPVNQSLRFEAEITNSGHVEARNVQVSLMADGAAPSDQAVLDSIPPGQSKKVSLFAKMREEGFHTVTVRVPADHLPADDERTIALRAIDSVGVLLVDGDPAGEPRERETFFLRHALTPVPQEAQKEFYVQPKTITANELGSAKLSDYETVVLANVGELSETTIQALDQYLRRGGGLIIFPGDKVNAQLYNEKLPFLPGKLGEAYGDAKTQSAFFTLQRDGYKHPIVAAWNDPGAGSLAVAHFYRAFDLQMPPADAKAEGGEPGRPLVVVNYSDGKPAVIERPWGFGRTILFSSTADTAWNDLPVHPSFVPLMQETMGAILNRGDERLNVRVGGKLHILANPDWVGRDVEIVKPGGKEAGATVRRLDLIDGVPILEFDETERTGSYRASVGGDASSALRFAVQSDPAESNIQELSEAQIEMLKSVAEVVHWKPGIELRQALGGQTTNTELWFALACLALAAAVVESIFAERFSRAR